MNLGKKWLIGNQNTDGGFGSSKVYGSTPEETAYATLGLKCHYNCMINNNEVMHDQIEIKNSIDRGVNFLLSIDYNNYDHPPFWIAESLYCPLNIVQAATVGAINL